ncbi:MAG TPA: phytanoyl-CoA dioxygenase family protein [Opitutus sp.]|nr:phytanoyl-CoA dioxygenase family protein [Opitutus sp.]
MTPPRPDAAAATNRSPRLDAAQVDEFNREGFLVFRAPVLPPAKFAALKAYFEDILAALPADERPEAMDVPHFAHPRLLEWAFDAAILDLVEPVVGPDIALFSTHFICKPLGNGRRVPWHEDSAYWKGKIEPMEVCTLWLAIDPSRQENGCMMVIPRTHREGRAGFSDYDDVDPRRNVFSSEIRKTQRDETRRVPIELEPNQCSLHDARIMHGSEPNTSRLRRCGWTLRFCPASVTFNEQAFAGLHQVYLARGRNLAGNVYADRTRANPDLLARRAASTAFKNSH